VPFVERVKGWCIDFQQTPRSLCVGLHFRRLGKQFHRLPNVGANAITDVGLDEASPTYGAERAIGKPMPPGLEKPDIDGVFLAGSA
jgi:hypothetical protein